MKNSRLIKRAISMRAAALMLSAIAVATSLCGCSDGKNKYGDNFIVEAEIPESSSDTAAIYSAVIPSSFDGETVRSLFFADSKDFIVDDSADGVVFYNDGKSTDQSALTLRKDGSEFSVHIPDASSYMNYVVYELVPGYTESSNTRYADIFDKEELGFMSREDAFSTVRDTFGKLGIEVPDDAEIYSIDYQTLQAWQDKSIAEFNETYGDFEEDNMFAGDVKYTLTEEDDFYLFCFRIECDGTPITSGAVNNANGSSIRVCMSANGIVFVDASGYYQVQEVTNASADILTCDKALDTAYNTYKTLFSDKKVTVNKIKYEYIPICEDEASGKYSLVPAWVLVSEIESDGETDTTAIYVNAVTGDVL